jgi:N6-adenosine-specific RNA methylase IME4/ParB-like chromosome segregation protein Spo0J
LPIDAIKVGKRHRKDMGDIAGLAASMAEIGVLHPVPVRPDGQLIAGGRRMAAFKLLGWKEIPVNIVDLDAIVRGEFAENAYTKPFTLSEAVAIKRALEPIERAAAKERQKRRPISSGKLPEQIKGNAADKAAKAAGMARRTLEKAEAIVDAAEAEPERFGKLLEKMDRTGRVNGVFKLLKIQKQAEIIRAEPLPLPGRGPYRVGVVDPSWQYGVRAEDPSHRGTPPYPPMTTEQICDLPVASIMHEDSILWLWVTNAHLVNGDAPKVLAAWGFTGMTMLTWVKQKFGTGEWLRGQTEHCIMAGRGKSIRTLTNQTTALFAPAREHSVKPVEFYDLVESLCPAPRYAYLFSRYRHNEKWDCHGDEAPLHEAPDDARLLEGLKATADTERRLAAWRKRRGAL